MQIEAVFTSIRIQSEEKITCMHSMIRAIKYGRIPYPFDNRFQVEQQLKPHGCSSLALLSFKNRL